MHDQKAELERVNKLNHSAAILAQITCQINSKPGVPPPNMHQFLPYPHAAEEILDCSALLINTVMGARDKLEPELAVLLEDPAISLRLGSSYYWLNGAWMYA
jgi:hypothetical protein